MILKKFVWKIISIVVVCALVFGTFAPTGIMGNQNIFAEDIFEQAAIEDGDLAVTDIEDEVASQKDEEVEDNKNVTEKTGETETISEAVLEEAFPPVAMLASDSEAKAKTDSVSTRALGDTIAANFPDPNLASKIASVLGKDVTDALTPADIGRTSLVLSNSNISDLTGIEVFANLLHLDISRNQLTSLPASITSLVKLQTFYIDHNQITALPADLGNLVKLHSFNISHNQIPALPDSFGNLVELMVFNGDNNKISYVPDSISNLSILIYFYLDDNELTSIPSSIGNMNDVEHLFLQRNQLTSIPATLGNMASLKALNVSENQLTVIPQNITNAASLKYLYMERNLLTKLPNNLENLSNLTHISFNNNLIETLPTGIENLTNLEYLIGSTNYIHDLPQAQFDWISTPRSTAFFHAQTYEKAVGEAFIDEDFNFTPLPIIVQAPEFTTSCNMSYRVLKPSGDTQIVAPVIEDGKVTLPAAVIDELGEYQFIAITQASHISGSRYTMTFEAVPQEAPVIPVDPTDPGNPTDPEKPKVSGSEDTDEKIGSTESRSSNATGKGSLKGLPKTGNEAVVFLGVSFLLAGIVIFVRRTYLNRRDR